MANEERVDRRSEGAYGFVCIVVSVIIFVMVCIGSVLVGIKIGERKMTDIERAAQNSEQQMEQMEEMLAILREMDDQIDRVTDSIQELESKVDALSPPVPQEGAENSTGTVDPQLPDNMQPPEGVQP